jgi:methylated-DNA-[protein]-cysteine S-methyltransferase
MTTTTGRIPSPLGPLYSVVRDGLLCELAYDDDRRGGRADPTVARALEAYFAGELDALDRIPVEPAGTPFQQTVWAALRRIPTGTTTSYGALARSIGAPAAMRAVGAANGRNPIAIVIPCHRVVASDGRLHGYGGGLDRKRWLLEHEGAISPLLARRA